MDSITCLFSWQYILQSCHGALHTSGHLKWQQFLCGGHWIKPWGHRLLQVSITNLGISVVSWIYGIWDFEQLYLERPWYWHSIRSTHKCLILVSLLFKRLTGGKHSTSSFIDVPQEYKDVLHTLVFRTNQAESTSNYFHKSYRRVILGLKVILRYSYMIRFRWS